MRTTEYRAGGFDASAPAQNRAREWDSDAGTFTRWDRAGAVVESRPLTVDEAAAFAEQAAALSADGNARTLEDRLRGFLDANRTFLALAAPTAADRNAQVARLTREASALIRYVLRDLADVSDTA